MRRLTRVMNLAPVAVVAFSSLLTIGFAPAALAATRTWTGNECLNTSDHKLSTATNWSGNTAPVAGDTLVFPDDPTCREVTNDFPAGTSFAAFQFTHPSAGAFGAYVFTGNSFGLPSGATITTDSNTPTEETFNVPVVLGGNLTLALNGSGVNFAGVVSGTGNITKNGPGYLSLGGANTYSGSLTANAGSVYQNSTTSFGPSNNSVSINDGADLNVACDVSDMANPVTLTGASSNPTGQYPTAKLMINTCAGGQGPDEDYGGPVSDGNVTLTGNFTLGSDVTFGSYIKTTTLTGALSGNHSFTLPGNWGGQLVVASSANTSGMANGTYKADTVSQTLSDDQASNTVQIESNAVITIDGTRGDTTVVSGGVLKGTGTVGALSVNSGATVAPGHSPGCLNSGNLTENGTYQAEIGGTDPCTGYDQLKVTGTVDVTGGTLDVERYNGFSDFKAGQSFTVIDNDGTDAVTGTFAGLDEGATLKLDNGTVLGISYKGGDGNDVVLSVKNVPTTPDTGFAALTAHPASTIMVTILAAGSIAALAKKTRKLATRK